MAVTPEESGTGHLASLRPSSYIGKRTSGHRSVEGEGRGPVPWLPLPPPVLKFCLPLLLVFLFWNVIVLQRYVSFCCTTTCISCMFTCICSVLSLPPTSCLHPSRSSEHRALQRPVLHSSFPLAVCPARGHVYMTMLLSQCITPSLSPTVSTSPLSMSVSLFLPCSSVPFFQIPYMCINMIFVFLFLTYFTLYDRLQVYPCLHKSPYLIPL